MITRNGKQRRAMQAISVAFCLAVTAGCGSDDKSDQSNSDNSGAVVYSTPAGTYQSKMGPDQTLVLNFTGNSDVAVTMRDGGHDESYQTTYSASGDTVTVNIPDAKKQAEGPDSMVLKRNGEAFEWTIEGMTIKFVKP